MTNKILIAGVFFVFIIISGLWLSRSGRPLNVFILTIHKLISLATLAFLIVTIVRIHRETPLSSPAILISAITLIFFIILIGTGGFLSNAKALPGMILRIHQIMPFFLMISTTGNLFLIYIRNS